AERHVGTLPLAGGAVFLGVLSSPRFSLVDLGKTGKCFPWLRAGAAARDVRKKNRAAVRRGGGKEVEAWFPRGGDTPGETGQRSGPSRAWVHESTAVHSLRDLCRAGVGRPGIDAGRQAVRNPAG